MILSIYGAYDNLSHNFIAFTTTPKNDGLAVRNLLSSLRMECNHEKDFLYNHLPIFAEYR